MSKSVFGRARGVRYSQPLRFEELEDRCMLSLTGDAPSPYPSASHSSGNASRLGASQSTDDGVVIGSIRAGQNNVSITVDVQGTSPGRLDAWIDFNRDGSFSGPWEQIVNNKLLSTGAIHTITFDIPSWAEIGSTWARFRISTAGNMPVGSSEPNGETEDYSITILPPASNLSTFGGQRIVHDSPQSAITAKPVFAADFDGDGDTDIVAATGSGDDVAWRRNNGNNTFTSLVVGSANDVRSIFAADVNGDDRMDVLAVSATDNTVYWYQNDGTPEMGAWMRATISNAASGVRSVFAADVDRDGDMDVVATSFLSDKVAWYENNGSQSFTERIVNVPDTDTNSGNGNGDVDAPAAVYVADINRDGNLDIVTASSVDGKVVWYQNDGTPATGAWTQRTIRSSVAATADPAEVSVVVADMNGDGNMDVVTSNFAEDRVAWFENDGTPTAGTWTRRNISTTANGASSVFAADVDSDGDIDVVSASSLDDKIAFYANNGNGIVFTPTTVNTADTDGNPNNGTNGNADGATHVVVADLNNDGDLDVISGSARDNKIAWYPILNASGILITQANNPLQVTEAGATAIFTVALASQPDSNVVLQVFSDMTDEATVSHATLTFTPANWKTQQTVTVTGVNDFLDDGNQSSTVTVRVNDASSDNTYDSVADVLVSVNTTDNDTADFTVTQTGGSTQVGETSTTDTFAVVLTSQPTSNVVIGLSSNDTGEATLSASTLTFTPANWSVAQTVTVTGVNDNVIDGNQTSTITVQVIDATSDDTYDPLPNKTVSVTTTDSQSAGFTVTQTDGNTAVTEAATATDTFTVVLTGPPATNVVLTILSSDSGEATTDPTSLTFTPDNWNVAQTVAVKSVDDFLIDGSQNSTITIRVNDAPSDNLFDPLADKTVTVSTADNDVAGFTITETGGKTQVSEIGNTDTFTVVLTAQPSSNVVFEVFSSDIGEATVGPATLTFTTANWNTPQTVTVTGDNDVNPDGPQTSTITIRITDASSDDNFDPLADKTVSVVTTDNESPPPGDYDIDGDVDTDDYAKWSQQFEQSATDADGNKDGNIDAADFVMWQKLHAAESAGGGGVDNGGGGGATASVEAPISMVMVATPELAADLQVATKFAAVPNEFIATAAASAVPRVASFATFGRANGWRASESIGKLHLHCLATALAVVAPIAQNVVNGSDHAISEVEFVDAAFTCDDVVSELTANLKTDWESWN